MAKSLRSFPEDQRKVRALFRLENCTGLSKCGAQDYFRAIYAVPKVIKLTEGSTEVIDNEETSGVF